MPGYDLRLWYEREFIALNASAIERNQCLEHHDAVHDRRSPQDDLVGVFLAENTCGRGVIRRGPTLLGERLEIHLGEALDAPPKIDGIYPGAVCPRGQPYLLRLAERYYLYHDACTAQCLQGSDAIGAIEMHEAVGSNASRSDWTYDDGVFEDPLLLYGIPQCHKARRVRVFVDPDGVERHNLQVEGRPAWDQIGVRAWVHISLTLLRRVTCSCCLRSD